MKEALFLGVAAVLLAGPAAPAADADAWLDGWDRFLGRGPDPDAPAPMVRLHHPWGVEERMLGQDEARALLQSVLGPSPSATDASQMQGWGHDAEAFRAAFGWTRCDVASMLVITSGHAPFDIEAIPSPVPLDPRPVCGELYGRTHTWLDVSMPVEPLDFSKCLRAMALVAPSATTIPGGWSCGAEAVSAHGNGAVFQFVGFGFTFGLFAGQSAVVTGGFAVE